MGTASYLDKHKINCDTVNKVIEGRPHVVDHIKNGDVQLVVNTTFGEKEISQSYSIRRESLIKNVPYFTTIAASRAAVDAIEVLKMEGLEVRALQDYYNDTTNSKLQAPNFK
jgi:carbamoyl-phosphate synthase large subunit